jgi:single-strand DNA-binding protein
MGTQIIIITGNLGKDPEIFTYESGDKKASFSVAVSESWKNKAGEKVEETEWFNVAMFRGLAGVAENYLKKGSKVYIEGKLKSREYQDKEGQTRRATELIASKMTMLSTLAEANGGNPNPSPNQAEETDSDVPF